MVESKRAARAARILEQFRAHLWQHEITVFAHSDRPLWIWSIGGHTRP